MNSMLRGAAIAGVTLLLAGTVSVGPVFPDEGRHGGTASGDPGHGRARTSDDTLVPALPETAVDIPAISVTGRTIHVPADGNLQEALDQAKPGDVITLAPGAIYRGPFELRRKDGEQWIVIASSAKDLPEPGRRVNPSDAPRMPKIVAASGSVFRTEAGAHHYRLVGLEIAPADGKALTNLVELGGDERSVEALPHHVIIDRCYLHGDRTAGSRRGVSLNASHVAIVDSYLSDFKERTTDAQAIAGWNGPGPFLIAGNYLEASGENVMFGGGDPAIQDLVPSDIRILRNHLAKPRRWKKDDPSFEGTQWAVKNLFELKNARRVLVDGNLFEYNWPAAQNGFAILFTVRNQDGRAPWSVVEDVTFTNNVIRHIAAGINILGRDDNHPSGQTRRITIRNNVFLDVGGPWGHGRLFQLLDGTHGIAIVHNTAVHTGSLIFGGDHRAHTGFAFEGNVVAHNDYGVSASGTAPGRQTLDRFFPNAVFRGNVIVGGQSGNYPPGNTFPRPGSGSALPQRVLDAPPSRDKADARAGADFDAIRAALGALADLLEP